MAKADLITEVSSGVSGTYLEESNNLSDVASKDTSKLNLEVPDVGSQPNQTPLNLHLGSLAYADADSVSVAELEVESTTGTATTQALTVTDGTDTNFVVQEDGKVGVGTSSPSSFDGNADDLAIQTAGHTGLTIRSSSVATGNLNFASGISGDQRYRGYIKYDHNGPDAMVFGTSATERVRIGSSGNVGVGQSSPSAGLHLEKASEDNVLAVVGQTGYNGTLFLAADGSGKDTYLTVGGNRNLLVDFATSSTPAATGTTKFTFSKLGNLVMTGGGGIDFSAAATSAGGGTGTTGTPSSSVMSDYEFGSWEPSFATSGADFTTMTMDVRAAQYVKVGRHVHCQAYIRTDNVDATGASGTVVVQGLPFIPDATTANYSTLNVGYSALWVNAPSAGYVQPNAAYVSLVRYSTTGSSLITPSDLTAGSSADKNELIFSVSYIAST